MKSCSVLSFRRLSMSRWKSCFAWHTSPGLHTLRRSLRRQSFPRLKLRRFSNLWPGQALWSSRWGTKGGFWLAQSADRIRAAEVIDFLSCRSRGRSQEQQDPLARALACVFVRCQKAFDEITIADLGKSGERSIARESAATCQWWILIVFPWFRSEEHTSELQ